ncbi:MAG TPA: hypothetical protein VK856_15090 [Anaerolineaceae bacterium]|nr:hypothetical protein [Anaerolineaceae bacterium]
MINKPDQKTVAWLLDSDPAIRWQVMRDLIHAPEHEVAQERARIASEGVGAKILTLQRSDGTWSGVAWNHGWNSTMHALNLLREFGLDPSSDEAIHAMSLVRENVTWKGCGPKECDQNSYFTGEIEPCINGQVAASGAYFNQNVQGIIHRLLSEQLSDGGWNCEAEFGSTRSSFNTTICVLEALLEYEISTGGNPEVMKARLRGQEYLLERHLFRRKSTGEIIKQDRVEGASWTSFAFPTWWHYDILRGLDYLRKTGHTPDERVKDAVEVVLSKRNQDGRWILDTQYPGENLVEFNDGVGQLDRWITLQALRVLEWYSARD